MNNLYTTIFAKHKFYNPDTAKFYNPEVDQKVAIITGGNQGTGFFVILQLYLHGFTVYLFGRSEEKCLKALDEIKQEANVRRGAYNQQQLSERFVGQLKYIKCDLTDLSSVDAACKQFIKQQSKLDILINNAGLMAAANEMTTDNYEIQYQVNVVGHLLLSLNLVPYLSKSNDARIIFLSSIAHTLPTGYLKPEDELNKFPEQLYRFLRYARAKLAAIHITKRLSQEFPNILSMAVHPGIINSSLFDETFNSFSILGPIFRTIFFKGLSFASITAEQGSLATLRAALDTSLTSDDDNGRYFDNGGLDTEPSTNGQNSDYINYTWNWNITELRKRGYKFDI